MNLILRNAVIAIDMCYGDVVASTNEKGFYSLYFFAQILILVNFL
mgnify:CR=1 FL=1